MFYKNIFILNPLGEASDMYNNIYNIINKLPSNTKIYCGHEYTITNLR